MIDGLDFNSIKQVFAAAGYKIQYANYGQYADQVPFVGRVRMYHIELSIGGKKPDCFVLYTEPCNTENFFGAARHKRVMSFIRRYNRRHLLYRQDIINQHQDMATVMEFCS
jgi:hypothetical protein